MYILYIIIPLLLCNLYTAARAGLIHHLALNLFCNTKYDMGPVSKDVRRDTLPSRPPAGLHTHPILDALQNGTGLTEDMYLGERFGGYTITRRLGKGGMGMVFLGEDPDNVRVPLAAIKLLPPDLLSVPSARTRFSNEISALSNLHHKNIVSYYGMGEIEGITYLLMEYLQGRDLGAHINPDHRLSVIETIRVMAQVCSAMELAHSMDLVHRDLKPENIFLMDGTDFEVRIIDFGLVKAINPGHGWKEDLTQPGTFVGTLHYVAPEVITLSPSDHRLDIYSAGILLYRFLCGRLPFDPHDYPELDEHKSADRAVMNLKIATRHIREPPRPPIEIVPDLPQGMNELILSALEKNPKDRIQSFGEMEAALNAVAERAGLDLNMFEVSSPRPVSIHAPRKTRTYIVLPAAVALLSAFAGALPAYHLLNRTPEPAPQVEVTPVVEPAPEQLPVKAPVQEPFQLKVTTVPSTAFVDLEFTRPDGQVYYQNIGQGSIDKPLTEPGIIRVTEKGYLTQRFLVNPANSNLSVVLSPRSE